MQTSLLIVMALFLDSALYLLSPYTYFIGLFYLTDEQFINAQHLRCTFLFTGEQTICIMLYLQI